MTRWPLNPNVVDACSRCSVKLPPATKGIPTDADLEELSARAAAGQDPEHLYLWQPTLGDAPQYLCGRCIIEYPRTTL